VDFRKNSVKHFRDALERADTSPQPFDSAAKRREVNMPVGDRSFGKVMTVAFQCAVKSFSKIGCRICSGGFNPIGEQVRCR
jgi:hypothetical protein